MLLLPACCAISRARNSSALTAAQECELLLGFHALRHDFHAQAPSHVDDRAHDGRLIGIRGGVPDEGLVDLERADRELLQGTQRGVAGTEVIDRQVQSHGIQLIEELHGALCVRHQGGLRDLELEECRGDAVLLEY